MSKVLKLCQHCLKPTKNPKYCSKSCSIIVNNTLPRKRMIPNKQYICKHCNILIGIGYKFDRNLCDQCFQATKKYDWDNITLKELKQQLNTFQTHARIRAKARQVYNKNCTFKCLNCKYPHYIEVCHIKSISSYDESAKIAEINHIDNLVGLCPNCHWELDHGFLKLENIKINGRE